MKTDTTRGTHSKGAKIEIKLVFVIVTLKLETCRFSWRKTSDSFLLETLKLIKDIADEVKFLKFSHLCI